MEEGPVATMSFAAHALLPALLISLAALAPAGAEPRAATNRMTCAEATALVRRAGEMTIGTGAGGSERLVRDRGFCEMTEIAELRFVPTRDNPQCPIGYRCKEPDYESWNWNVE